MISDSRFIVTDDAAGLERISDIPGCFSISGTLCLTHDRNSDNEKSSNVFFIITMRIFVSSFNFIRRIEKDHLNRKSVFSTTGIAIGAEYKNAPGGSMYPRFSATMQTS